MKDCLCYEASRAIFSSFINLMLKSKEGILFASKANNMFMPDLQHFIFTAHLSVSGLPFFSQVFLSFYNQLTGPESQEPWIYIVFYSYMAC